MQWSTALLSIALSALSTNALLRFPCSQLTIQRLDPLLQPGTVSGHLHQIVGGNAFNVTMDPRNDLPRLSTCTSCTFTEDFSNYWTAVLYFRSRDGKFKRVKQLPGSGLGNVNGGMSVYYLQPNNGQKTVAFAKGFRVIVGNAMLRQYQSGPEANSLTFRCLTAGGGNGGVVGDPGSDTNQLPTKKCEGGIRSQIIFPSCWNSARDLDSPDHKSHVAYPSSNGNCPSSHPVQLPTLFIETWWDTTEFNDQWWTPSDAQQPFVYTMGDPVGVGQHADYMFGWEGDSLQRAMDSCNDFGGACSILKTQSVDAANRCTQGARIDEPYEGWLDRLPGCNPVQPGPARATQAVGCGAPTEILPGGPTATPTYSPTPTGGTGTTTAPGAVQTKYGQCGGKDWKGPTTCVAGTTCKFSNDWYSQCL